MLSPRDVGSRVSVRHRVGDGLRTDVLGQLVSWQDGLLRVRRADGEVIDIEESAVETGRTVPPAPPRRPPGVPHVSVEDMQRIANAGWPARDTDPLGDWLLRAHGGITGRANSVMAVGDPGIELDEALARIETWYAERALPPLLQLPVGSPLNSPLEERGWRELHVTLVQTNSIPATLGRIPENSQLRSIVRAEPDAAWLALMHDLDPDDPVAHIAILTGPQRVGFATVFQADEAVGIGRVSIEGTWAGVTSVDVAPARRRQGLGGAVMRMLLEWAAAQGASATYLQVRAKNEPALALYRRLGFVTHHPYCYRARGSG